MKKIPRRLALLSAVTLLAATHAAAAPVPDPEIVRFDIERYDVRGNTLLPPEQVARLLAPYTGRGRDFGDVQQALEALTAAYQAAGYRLVAVTLPEQELARGAVRLEVVQTRIGQVQVRGQRHVDEANVRRALPQLRAGEVPNLDDISAALKLANEHPARQVTMKLQSGAREDEVDALLEVADERQWKAMLNVDNSGTEQTGRAHIGFGLQHANLFGLDHLASLQYTTSAKEPGRVKVYGLGYHIPLYKLGDTLDFYASYSNIDSGTVAVGAFSVAVSGQGTVFGARYSHYLARHAGYEGKLLFGAESKAFRNSVLLLGQELGNHVTVRPLSVGYQGSWSSPRGDSGLSLTLLRNLPGGKRGGQDDFHRARAGAPDDYTILRAGASISRLLPGEWQWRAIANAQYTLDALVPGEQFGVGGGASVRGLPERELANDKGAGLNLELYTPPLCGERWQCRLLAFHDRAHVRRNDALPGELRTASVASIGLGLRLLLGSQANLQLDYGHVVQGGPSGRDGSGRLHLRLGLAY
ncbi:Hemolysin activation/secretion protein [Duganella sp. CF458]|uniref:ShlB/FhaC/HecB family hemolysin secretion/activation protein n=1 Tax=Duganella sp. CF458 TaxID=1884368 RepID=UPI0008E7A8AF|nr:ShlB/FhaC/HecB family hemolysin secretion/activation protein [Duganella sp. CF458]SFG27166.1 Hemolysin activation/secretion protein [Duganella sp. CF458]